MGYLSVIFDLDGTLLDTLKDIAETANTVLAEHGFPVHSPNDFKNYVGDGLLVLMQRIVPTNTPKYLVESCCRRFLELYSNTWQNNCQPYEGIIEMLDGLSSRGVSMAVLSNKPHAFTKLFIARYFPEQPFIAVYGQRQGIPKKPDPTVALAIATIQNVLPQDTLFVGDTGIDIRTGKASGMTTVGVSWGFRSVAELEKEKPNIIIHHPSELISYAFSKS
jgi:phosphoglycolate phosphatase